MMLPNDCGFSGRHKIRRAVFETLESRRMFAFGVTATSGSYTVDTGAQTVFTISRTNGDMTSMKFNGTELEAPFSVAARYSHYESGLSSTTTAVSAITDPAGNWIKITCDDTTGVGVIHYYIARKGFNNIYMATYAATLPSPGEMRYITYTNHSVLTNAPNPSDTSSSTSTVEGSDVFLNPDGTTHSKFYGAARMIDDVYHGLTGTNVGLFMNMGNRESGSGGPFFKDIEYQTTSSSVSELYNYMYSGHTQPDAYRPGLQGTYALQFTNGSAPVTPDYSFIDGLGLTGSVLPSGRGMLTGNASGVPAGREVTVGLSNAAAQYWTHPDAVTGNYAIAAVKSGTYTETLYQDELEVGTRSVTITAGANTAANITDTYYLPNAIWRIGSWDGTPAGFLNYDRIGTMHPSDVRMSAWTSTVYTVGTSPDSTWPLAQFRDVNGDNQIVFNLTAAQASTPLTMRIGLTFAFAGGRPIISVNGGTYSSAQTPSTQPNSRGITRGTWRGNNWLYTYNLSTASLHAGLNTINIGVASGSSGVGFLSPSFTFDALDLVPTSSNGVPTIVTPAGANPNPIAGGSTTLSVLGADDGGESNLKYTWSLLGTPPGSVAFSINGNNAAKNTVATFGSAGVYTFLVTITDAFGLSTTSSVNATVNSAVVSRAIFYNNSFFDGTDVTANALDDNAIAPDKSALLPGQTTTFNNYTSFDKGINGLMVDVANLPAGPVTAADFSFQVSADGSVWNPAPVAAVPSVLVRTAMGTGGSDRIEITFTDLSIRNQWLRITMNANANTGLAAPDVFYFGNLVGCSGMHTNVGVVNNTDAIAARIKINTVATISSVLDYNRSGMVTNTDVITVRINNLHGLTYFTAPLPGPTAGSAPAAVAQSASVPATSIPPFSIIPILPTWMTEIATKNKILL